MAGLLINLMVTSLFTKNKLYISINLIVIGAFSVSGYLHQTISNTKQLPYINNVRIIQPYTKFSNAQNYPGQTFDTIDQLSKSPGEEKVDLLIWPEGSLPYIFFNSLAEIKIWQSYLPSKSNSSLIFGVERVTDKQYFNSLIAVNRNNLSIYDKHILIPFGEF